MSDGAAIAHGTTTHIATKSPTLKECLQAKDSNPERQADDQTVAFLALVCTYDRDDVLVQQGVLNGSLQKYVPVAIDAFIHYLFLTIQRYPDTKEKAYVRNYQTSFLLAVSGKRRTLDSERLPLMPPGWITKKEKCKP